MDKHSSYSDVDLINLAQQGNKEAYSLLILRYSNKIQQIIYFHVQDHTLVADLTQEVLLKIYKYLYFFKEKSQFSTWIYRITQNTIKNHYRNSNLRLDLETEYNDNFYSSTHFSPEYLVSNEELEKQLVRAFATLSDELRLCYGMYLLDGQSYEEIAKNMKCPIGTVRSRIFRAKKMLMAYVDPFI